MYKTKKTLPLNGYEHAYNPSVWNTNPNKSTHNCYSYFLNDLDDNRQLFPQPWGISGLRYMYANRGRVKPEAVFKKYGIQKPYTCDKLVKAVLEDNPEIKKGRRYEKCPPNTYKGFLAVDNQGKDRDYHFWVQH